MFRVVRYMGSYWAIQRRVFSFLWIFNFWSFLRHGDICTCGGVDGDQVERFDTEEQAEKFVTKLKIGILLRDS